MRTKSIRPSHSLSKYHDKYNKICDITSVSVLHECVMCWALGKPFGIFQTNQKTIIQLHNDVRMSDKVKNEKK